MLLKDLSKKYHCCTKTGN